MSRLPKRIRAVLAEILVAIAFLGGWTLLTWGVARLTSQDAWIFSGGLLLLSLVGWRLMLTIAVAGFYDLMGSPESDDA